MLPDSVWCVSGLDTMLPPERRPESFLEQRGIPGGGLCSPPAWHRAVGEGAALKAGGLASDPSFCPGSLRRLQPFWATSSSAPWDNVYLAGCREDSKENGTSGSPSACVKAPSLGLSHTAAALVPLLFGIWGGAVQAGELECRIFTEMPAAIRVIHLPQSPASWAQTPFLVTFRLELASSL